MIFRTQDLSVAIRRSLQPEQPEQKREAVRQESFPAIAGRTIWRLKCPPGSQIYCGIVPREVYGLPWHAALVLCWLRRGGLNAPIPRGCSMACTLRIRPPCIVPDTPREPLSTGSSRTISTAMSGHTRNASSRILGPCGRSWCARSKSSLPVAGRGRRQNSQSNQRAASVLRSVAWRKSSPSRIFPEGSAVANRAPWIDEKECFGNVTQKFNPILLRRIPAYGF